MTGRFSFFGLLLIVCLFLSVRLSAQLSGTYTLGDAQSDYPTFTEAVNAIRQEGLAGNVEFHVRPGVYHYVTVSDVVNDELFTVLFVYDGTAGDSAVISGWLKVANSPGIVFRGFTIHPVQNQVASCVNISLANNFELDSCRVLNLYNCDFDYDEGLIKLSFPYDGAYLINRITNCRIHSEERTFAFGGAKGSVWLQGNTITGTITPPAIEKNGLFALKLHYLDNVFYCRSNDFERAGQEFIRNTFYFESIFTLKIQGDLFGNVFYTDVEIAASDVIGNVFYGSAEMKWCNNANVYGNQMHGRFRTIYSHGIKIANNTFFKSVRLTNDNTSFWNNLAYDSVSFTQGPGQFVFNNNFHRNSRLYLGWTSGKLINNNLGDLYIESPQVPSWTIEDNNFVNAENGSVCCFGDNARFYNPLYDSSLHANNPLLTGKGGKIYPRFKYDVDSVLRKKPCTIGANEICFSWQVPMMELSCSDSLKLDLCLDSLSGAYWSPGYLFEDSTQTDVLIFPREDVTVFLKNPDGSVIGLLEIRTQRDAAPIARATYSIEGFQVYFNNRSLCAESYLWEFGDGLSSAEESPVHTYAESGNYVCTLTVNNELGADELVMNILSLSVNLTTRQQSFRIYPNPVDRTVTIEREHGFSGLKVVDLYGRSVLIREPGFTRRTKLNISHLPDGMYFIQIQTDKGILVQRLLKLR